MIKRMMMILCAIMLTASIIRLMNLTKKEIGRNGKSSLLHLNIASLGTHKDDFEDMLLILDLDFDILGLTETRVIKEQIPTIHLLLGIRNISHQQNQPKAILRYISIKIF